MIYTLFFLLAFVFFIASMFADEGRWPLWSLGAVVWVVTFLFWAQTW